VPQSARRWRLAKKDTPLSDTTSFRQAELAN
jgi:hypothetical protein